MVLQTPPGQPWQAPRGAVRPAVRWGLPDAVLVWIAGVVAAVLAATVSAALRHPAVVADDPVVFAASVVGQYAGMLGLFVLTSRRKGLGGLACDFGLRLDLRRDWSFVPVGFGLQIAANLALVPIALLANRSEAAQDVVQRLETTHGIELLFIVLAAAVLAPVIEEMLFRGLLLRALLRRMGPTPAVAVSALVFASVHLLDPGALLVLPGLLAVGIVNGILAVRSGDLSRPILLHVGFNLLVVLLALGGG